VYPDDRWTPDRLTSSLTGSATGSKAKPRRPESGAVTSGRAIPYRRSPSKSADQSLALASRSELAKDRLTDLIKTACELRLAKVNA
jgi:hypothetical protein